jgi:hypothetical protein
MTMPETLLTVIANAVEAAHTAEEDIAFIKNDVRKRTFASALKEFRRLTGETPTAEETIEIRSEVADLLTRMEKLVQEITVVSSAPDATVPPDIAAVAGNPVRAWELVSASLRPVAP